MAKSDLYSPDTIRAKCLLLGYARDDGDIEKARKWAEDLLSTRRITDTVGRTLHEEVGNAIQFYAEFLNKNGLKLEAAAVYDSLGSRFPNSSLAEKCRLAAREAMCSYHLRLAGYRIKNQQFGKTIGRKRRTGGTLTITGLHRVCRKIRVLRE